MKNKMLDCFFSKKVSLKVYKSVFENCEINL